MPINNTNKNKRTVLLPSLLAKRGNYYFLNLYFLWGLHVCLFIFLTLTQKLSHCLPPYFSSQTEYRHFPAVVETQFYSVMAELSWGLWIVIFS